MKNSETNQNQDKNFQIKPKYNHQNETPSVQSNTHPFSNFRQQNIDDNLVSKITGDDGNITFEILDDDKEESKRSFQIDQRLENTGIGNQKRLNKINDLLDEVHQSSFQQKSKDSQNKNQNVNIDQKSSKITKQHYADYSLNSNQDINQYQDQNFYNLSQNPLTKIQSHEAGSNYNTEYQIKLEIESHGPNGNDFQHNSNNKNQTLENINKDSKQIYIQNFENQEEFNDENISNEIKQENQKYQILLKQASMSIEEIDNKKLQNDYQRYNSRFKTNNQQISYSQFKQQRKNNLKNRQSQKTMIKLQNQYNEINNAIEKNGLKVDVNSSNYDRLNSQFVGSSNNQLQNGNQIDQASDLQIHEVSFTQQIFQSISKRLDKIQTALIPTNPLILIIDLFVFFVIMLELWTIPIRFGVKDEEINFYMVDYFQEFGILAIFLKMCFSINTGIFIGGLITLQRDKIVEQYIKRFLLIDILCIVALVVKQRYFSLIFFFQYPRIKLITQAMDMYLQLSTKFQTIAKILNLIFLILVVAHISACGFLWITIVDKDQSESWIISTSLQEANWDKRYLNAVYFMIITMSTIGYGDVSPVTVYEKIYGIVISLIACGIFGFAINMIGTIFQEKAQREADYVYNRQQALKFMQIRNISKEGQTKVLKFLEHQFNQESLEGNLQKGQTVINSVSKNLQEEIYKEFYFPILKKCEIIPTYFSLKFVEKLCLLMRETNFSEGENIYSSETEAQQHLYYVIKGSIQVYDNLSTKVKGLIESGSFFGYNYFFLDTYPINEVLRSETDSQILYIKRQDFLSLLDEFPKEKENYTQVQHKILNQEGNFQKCVFCHTFDHNSQFCSLVHYIPYKEKIKIQNNQTYQLNQKRKRYFRDKEKIRAEIRFQSLQGKKFYRYDAIDIRRDLIELDKEYKKLSEIFDEMDEDDDEIVLKLRPSIQFPLVDGQQYNMIKIQPLTEFLEENQNNQYNDLYPDFSAITTDDQVEQLQTQTFQGSIASFDRQSYKPQPFRQKKSKIKSNQTSQSILMIQNVMRESMAQSRQFKSITNKITNYSTTNINNQIAEVAQNQQQQQQPQIPMLCLNCQKQEQKQKIQIVDQYQKDEIEKEKMQILPDLDKVETFKVFKKWNNIDNVLASHKKYIVNIQNFRRNENQKIQQQKQLFQIQNQNDNFEFSNQIIQNIQLSQQKLKEKRESQQQSNFNSKNKLQIRKNGISSNSKISKKAKQAQSKLSIFQNPKSNSQQIKHTYEKSQQKNKNKTDHIKESAYYEESDVSNNDLQHLQNLRDNNNRYQKSAQKNIYNSQNQENSVNESIAELKNIQSSNLYINQYN